MKKALVLIIILVATASVAYLNRATIVSALIKQGVRTMLATDAVAELEDGLHIALCGAGGPMPAPKASGPCVAVIAGERLFVVDAGTDGVRNLIRMGYPTGAIEAVFLTHFHSDHIDGLGELGTIRWASGANTAPLPVHGPSGVEHVIGGFNTAYAHDFIYRHAHHGDTVAPLAGAGLAAEPFRKPAAGTLTTVLQGGGLRVEALAVDHSPIEPAVGYRFSYGGRSLLITGDTVQLDNVRKFAEGVDLLVHDALAPNLIGMLRDEAERAGNEIFAAVFHGIPDYHATPVEAAETARDAGVGHLLYYHIVPPMVVPGQETLFLNGADQIFPEYTMGRDGVAFSLPAGSDEIIRTRRGL